MSWHAERFEMNPDRFRFDCVGCSRPMYFPKSKLGMYKTCGSECKEMMRDKTIASRTLNCATCSTAFTPRPGQVAKGQGKFCSQQCNSTAREAINSPEARAKSKNTMRKLFAAGVLKGMRGEDNPRWNGGKAATRVRNLIRQAQYKRDNPDKLRVWSANRRKRAQGKLSPELVPKLRVMQKSRCAVCRDRLKSDCHLDHIEPLARGGLNTDSNMQLLCADCNARKAAKDPLTFMQERGFLL